MRRPCMSSATTSSGLSLARARKPTRSDPRPSTCTISELSRWRRITSAIDQSTANMSDWVTVEACDTSSDSCLLVIVPVGTILAYHLP